jgi:hypothetical protein
MRNGSMDCRVKPGNDDGTNVASMERSAVSSRIATLASLIRTTLVVKAMPTINLYIGPGRACIIGSHRGHSSLGVMCARANKMRLSLLSCLLP